MSNRRSSGGRASALKRLSITRGAMYLLFAEVGASVIYLLASDETQALLAEWLVVTSDRVFGELRVWTLLTTSFLEIEFISLLFHGLMLWMFVPTLERWWGTKKFLLFALWTMLAGNLAGALVGLLVGAAPVAGLDPFIYATVVAFGILYADHKVQFFGVVPLTGRQMMLGICAVVALIILVGAQWVAGASYVAAMLMAWALVSGKLHPKLMYLRWKQRRIRRKLSVLRGGAGRDPGERDGWVN